MFREADAECYTSFALFLLSELEESDVYATADRGRSHMGRASLLATRPTDKSGTRADTDGSGGPPHRRVKRISEARYCALETPREWMTQPEGVGIVDRIPARIPVQVQATSQANRVRLREPTRSETKLRQATANDKQLRRRAG
jgi:hypothetical protein